MSSTRFKSFPSSVIKLSLRGGWARLKGLRDHLIGRLQKENATLEALGNLFWMNHVRRSDLVADDMPKFESSPDVSKNFSWVINHWPNGWPKYVSKPPVRNCAQRF